jgi:hypothetical protein
MAVRTLDQKGRFRSIRPPHSRPAVPSIRKGRSTSTSVMATNSMT